MKLHIASVTALAALLAAGPARAEPHPMDVRLDVKSESHSTAMTAPIQGAFLGLSRVVAPASPLQPRIYLTGGGLYGLESSALAAEAGASMSYYAGGGVEGVGLTVDAGLGVLSLHQGHDGEDLVAWALVTEPALVFTKGRFSALAGLRIKEVIHERMTYEDTGRTTEAMPWKTESGVKLGIRVAF